MTDAATGIEGRLAAAEAALDAGHAAQALEIADKVLAETGANGPALKLRARAYEALADYPAALVAWSEARDVMPKSGSVRVDRAKLLFRMGRFDEALSEHETAVTLDALQLEGWKGILALRPVACDEAGLDRVAASITDSTRSARLRAKAGFVLGQILFEAGEPDAAFDRYTQANAILAAESDPDSLEYRFPTGAFAINRAFIDSHHPAMPALPGCPAILIAGLPRSGKSLTESLIAADPMVRAGDELAILARFGRGFDWSQGAVPVAQLLAQMDTSPLAGLYINALKGKKRVTDTAPTNLFRLGLLGLLHPRVPIILCRRDTLDLGASMFFKQFRRGNLFTTTLPALGRAIARSERMMAHWRRELPNPVIEVGYEEMVADPATVARRLAALCETRAEAAQVASADPRPASRLTPGRSLGFGAVDQSLVGFAQVLKPRFAPMLEVYETERARLVAAGR